MGCTSCPEYGNNLMCPPLIQPPSEFRKKLLTYDRVILMQLIVQIQSDPAEAGYQEAYLHAVRLHHAVCNIELHGRFLGFPSATGYIAGCCRLCGTCPGFGKNCRNPDKARSSMEGNGIDVIETCANAGWEMAFPVRDKVSWTGLILLD